MPRPPSIAAHVLTFCCLLAPCCVLAPYAHAGTKVHPVHKKDMKQQVEDLEQQWRTATIAGDIPTLDRLLSEDYVGISMSGQVNTKIQQLDRFRNRTVIITRLDLSDVQVKLVGAVAIVTSRAEVEGSNDGNSMTGVYRYTRVYQRAGNGTWKITNFEATRVPQRGGPMRPDPADPKPDAKPEHPQAPKPATP